MVKHGKCFEKSVESERKEILLSLEMKQIVCEFSSEIKNQNGFVI